MKLMHFWFEFASTYSYPAAVRVERMAAARGVPVVWEPFILGPIFKAQGWADSPFNIYLAKGRYMWRDLERVCADLQVPLKRPSEFPRNSLLAARVAALCKNEPWIGRFVRAVYQANFALDQDIADPDVLRECLAHAGQSATALLDRASAPEAKYALKAQTDEAMRLGIFGAPSFVCGKELFWGNDRLESAMEWCGGQGPTGLTGANL